MIEFTYKNLLYFSTQNMAFQRNHSFHPHTFPVPLRPGTTTGTGKNLEEVQSCRKAYITLSYSSKYKTVGTDTGQWKKFPSGSAPDAFI